jgi:hypothetical protein
VFLESGDLPMLRCLSFTILFALALTIAGCGSTSSEISAKKDAGPTMSAEEAKQKALQGMPPDIRKRMESQMQKQKMKK